MYPFALSPDMDYYVRDNFFEDWGYQGHPKHWQPPNQNGGVPRWIQFNNNGREIDGPAACPSIELVDAKVACDQVLESAGCWPRDRVTRRMIEEVRTKTGSWGRHGPNAPDDAWYLEGLTPGTAPADRDQDGLPDAWESKHSLNLADPSDASRIVPPAASDKDRHRGYTYLEFYLNELADGLLLQ